jgi:hypothetical protein
VNEVGGGVLTGETPGILCRRACKGMPFPARAPGRAGGNRKCGRKSAGIGLSSDHFATEWVSCVAHMEVIDLPEWGRCPRCCFAESIVNEHMAHSRATIAVGQLLVQDLRGAACEEATGGFEHAGNDYVLHADRHGIRMETSRCARQIATV